MPGRQAALPLFPARGKHRAYREPKEPAPKEFALHWLWLTISGLLRITEWR
jgi:hypothetical protein